MDRRRFVTVTAGAGTGLVLGLTLDGCRPEPLPETPSTDFAPNAWLRIAPDGTVTVTVDRSEMGQGVSTALPMLVAEEFDADWARVRYQFAPANEAYYNPALGLQGTGGSTAVSVAWLPLRRAGATARAMLIAAAAKQWGVPVSECSTEPGVVRHAGSGRRADYGSLATAASREPVPPEVPLKSPEQFRLIGTPVSRLDLREKVTGSAVFGIDAGPRDALVALVARCPVWGGRVGSFDPAPALAIPGVRRVLPIPSGVAVVADGFWAARRGRDALTISWTEGSAGAVDDSSIDRELETLVRGEGRVARREGVAPAAVARTIQATYQVPFLAHATMEPMNCVADVRKNSVTVWVPTQFQAAPWYLAGGGAKGVAASVAGVAPERVTVHTTYLGGGFGRRFELDVVREAVELSKRVGGPVRLIWTREDDLQHDWYRPAARHLLEAGLDHSGGVVSWNHRTASPSIMAKFMPGFLPEWATHLAGPLKGGIDQSAVEGAVDHRYRIPRVEVRYAQAHLPVPVGYWRSVGHSHTAFAVESFIDEIAHESGKDPIALRLSLLGDAPRHRGVLERVRQGAGWDSAPPAGVFRGVAVHESFASVVALVAEVSIAGGNRIRVHRVVAAIDCGMVVNPDTVRAQVESGIVFGLSAALMGRISIDQGRVAESNFHDYPVLRMSEMPVVETHIIPSRLDPTGVGEPATPPVAPAVANAVFAATGQRLRSLPLRLG